ncbi:MAG: DNA polymerase III subunit gamma/tau [Lautropia sp.]
MNQSTGTSPHLVLARKWRPRDFESLVGQETVVRALRHALDSGRLHHAYLLTGTRGVGKTTIARIIAKALNCETGVTSTPCGRCEACTGIDVGRFTDYIEMDAASNRKVEEMTAVLESAAYAPAVGRYKVFVIDEVHMLTNHAFNAMLKTLEEPPAQVVFVLATTDPQKVPVTVLSRCMQFGLRNMSPDAVSGHLEKVLLAEGIAFEPEALRLLGRASAGSMRDALSLLDQAIAVGGGAVAAAEVREMLGVVDDALVANLLTLLADAVDAGAADPRADVPAASDPAASDPARAAASPALELVSLADRMAVENAPFGQVLMSMAACLQRIAVLQLRLSRRRARGEAGSSTAPVGIEGAMGALAARLDPADVQAWYQILVHGVRDLPLAPDGHAGFVMTLVRLLAFTGVDSDAGPDAGRDAGRDPGPGAATARDRRASPGPVPGTVPGPAPAPAARSGGIAAASATGGIDAARAAARALARGDGPGARGAPPRGRDGAAAVPRPADGAADGPAPVAARAAPVDPPGGASGQADAGVAFDGDWAALAASVQAGGTDRQLLQQSELVSFDGRVFRLRVPLVQFAQAHIVARVADALGRRLGAAVRVEVEVGRTGSATAAVNAEKARAARQAQAQDAIEADPFVRELIDGFGATIVPDSITPVDGATPS